MHFSFGMQKNMVGCYRVGFGELNLIHVKMVRGLVFNIVKRMGEELGLSAVFLASWILKASVVPLFMMVIFLFKFITLITLLSKSTSLYFSTRLYALGSVRRLSPQGIT